MLSSLSKPGGTPTSLTKSWPYWRQQDCVLLCLPVSYIASRNEFSKKSTCMVSYTMLVVAFFANIQYVTCWSFEYCSRIADGLCISNSMCVVNLRRLLKGLNTVYRASSLVMDRIRWTSPYSNGVCVTCWWIEYRICVSDTRTYWWAQLIERSLRIDQILY